MSHDQDEISDTLRIIRATLAQRERVAVPYVELPPVGPDEKSAKEASALATGDLESRAAVSEYQRSERFRDHVALALLVVFWIAFAGIMIAGLVWGYHLMTPDSWHFLTSTQVNKIGDQLFGGVITSFVAGYAKKRLG